MKKSILLCSILVFVSCQGQTKKTEKEQFPVQKTESEWKSELSEMEYYVLRKAGTERAFSSEFNNNHKDGVYVCAACATPLFKSENKFDSGSGWPSFDREIKGNVAFSVDYNLGYARTEEHCANCGGHLGHVFNDGPSKTTGKRHCINGVALDFIPNN
ncbi:MAG: peptide-methionine (R)-S-oxide reductase MsrB [Flavobacteriaceae bacterium]|jgi:peptide-methionine (R)-S-oxide reductase|nr:peptide-methionine (R)-S-oxide reductase MsrB [Flavobacteriaceae bacterium]